MSIVVRLVLLAVQAVVMYLLAQRGYWLIFALIGIIAVLPFVALLGQRLQREERPRSSRVVLGFAVLLCVVMVAIAVTLLVTVLAG